MYKKLEELTPELQWKKDMHRRWKQGQATTDACGSTAQSYTVAIMKAEGQLELRCARGVKGNENSSYWYINNKKDEQGTCKLTDKMIIACTDKVEVPNAFFVLVWLKSASVIWRRDGFGCGLNLTAAFHHQRGGYPEEWTQTEVRAWRMKGSSH